MERALRDAVAVRSTKAITFFAFRDWVIVLLVSKVLHKEYSLPNTLTQKQIFFVSVSLHGLSSVRSVARTQPLKRLSLKRCSQNMIFSMTRNVSAKGSSLGA